MRRQTDRPPRLLEAVLRRITPYREREALLGDFEEYFERMAADGRRLRAFFWYLGCVLKLLPAFVREQIDWRCEMFKNSLKIALRNLSRHRGHSFINIAGLVIGLTCSLLILLWVQNERSYNRFHEKADKLYRVEVDQRFAGGTFHVWDTPQVMGPALREAIPEIRNIARTYLYIQTLLVRFEDKAFYESGAIAADPSFFQMFSFPLVRGSSASALSDPNSLVISEELARKYFGRDNPLDKTITIDNAHSFKIAGVMKDMPPNSTLQWKLILPFSFLKTLGLNNEEWGGYSTTTWVELRNGADVTAVNDKVTRLVWARQGETGADISNRSSFSLMPLPDIRLKGTFGYGQKIGTGSTVSIFSAIALFVLLMACINYMNLSTARSANRAKEIGLRKVAGASRQGIARQFYGESMVVTVLAAGSSFVLVILLLPVFNKIAETRIAASALSNPGFLLGLAAVIGLTGLVAGSYPAVFLSSFQPIRVLKGSLKSGTKSAFFRKALVVVQFALSVFLLLSTAVAYRQLNYMRTKSLGYDKDRLLYLPLRGDTPRAYGALKEELSKNPGIQNVTATSLRPTRIASNTSGGADWDGKDPNQNVLFGETAVDFDFTETMKIEMAAGRAFSKDMASDRSSAYLVNEEVVKAMGLSPAAAVGKRLNFVFDGTIIGVMKNFHLQSVQNSIEPRVFFVDPEQLRFAVVRLQAGDIPSALDGVRKSWEKIYPLYPFEYKFFDGDFDVMYRADKRMGLILKVFAVMAVTIACLGLFGLVSFAAEQRTKEIGIRKVLGASVPGIVVLMSKEFAFWVLTANAVAWPLGQLVLRKWLQGFAFRTGVAWWLFPAVGLGTLAAALLTVGVQAVRAARANPAESLKYE